ncbi:unnamed protein product, partial [Linum tenue]
MRRELLFIHIWGLGRGLGACQAINAVVGRLRLSDTVHCTFGRGCP